MKQWISAGMLASVLWLTGCQTSAGMAEFTSDGCSLFPDGTPSSPAQWCDCCFAHDRAYWQGGTQGERQQADQALRRCVLDRTGNPALADMMYRGVRGGGSPVFPAWYRWGYGWPYGRGYRPLAAEERQQAQQLLQRYDRLHPTGFCQQP